MLIIVLLEMKFHWEIVSERTIDKVGKHVHQQIWRLSR